MRAVSIGLFVLASCAVDEVDELDELDTVEQSVVAASWDGDYETGDKSQWAIGTEGLGACANDLIDVQTTPLRQGSYVARFEVNDTCLFDSKETPSEIRDDDQKVELSSDPDQSNGYEGANVYYGWSVYVPSSSPIPHEGLSTWITQWKLQHVTDQCGGQNANAALGLVVRNGVEHLRFIVSGGECTGATDSDGKVIKLPTQSIEFVEPFVRSRWHDFVLHVRWSPGSDGLAELWWNGTKRVSWAHPNMFEEGGVTNPVRVRQGIYRDFCQGGLNCDHRPWVLYHDAMRRSATYQDVALPNVSFERWVTSSSPRSWLSTGSRGFALTTFAKHSGFRTCTGGNGAYSLRIVGTHDGSTTAMARGVRQEDGVKSTRVAPGASYTARAEICSVNPPGSRGYRIRVFWFRADGSPSSTVSSTGPESGARTTGLVRPWFDVVAPADAAFGRLQVEAVSATPNDTVDFNVDLAGLWNN